MSGAARCSLDQRSEISQVVLVRLLKLSTGVKLDGHEAVAFVFVVQVELASGSKAVTWVVSEQDDGSVALPSQLVQTCGYELATNPLTLMTPALISALAGRSQIMRPT